MRTVLFGGTDVTLAIAETMRNQAIEIAGVVTIGKEFTISYRKEGVRNSRHQDMISWARKLCIPAIEFTNFKDTAEYIEDFNGDFGLVAGWYHMVPEGIRRMFKKGCAGLHASLLPTYRGGAPLNWALLDGATETGVSLFELGDGIDDGPIYGQERFSIAERATIAELVQQSKSASVKLVERCLPEIASGHLQPVPQVGEPVYTLQRGPEDGQIDWRESANSIDRLVRAVAHPYPGARTVLDGETIVIWSAYPLEIPRVLGRPGQIARIPEQDNPVVICGCGLLVVNEASSVDGSDAMPLIKGHANEKFDCI